MGGHIDPALLRRLGRKEAWAPEALTAIGLPAALVRTMVVDGARVVPMRPRLTVAGRRRGEASRRYVWGPDIATHLGGRLPDPPAK